MKDLRAKQPDAGTLQTILAELRQYLAAHYGARLVAVMLFGSQARGDATAGSDIDVLIVLQGAVSPLDEIRRTSAFCAALSLKYDVVVSRLFVSEDRFLHEQSPLLLNVRREGVGI